MKRLVYLGLVLIVTLVAVCFFLASAAPAGTTAAGTAAAIIVTTADDELNSDGDCSLREAIQAVNTHTTVDACTFVSGDSILTLPAATYNLTLPGAKEDANATGDLDIHSSLAINGAGADTTVINGGSLDRVLHILSSTVSIQGVTITGGKSPDAAPGSGDGEDGGGLYVAANVIVTMTDSSIRGNTTGSDGGNSGSGRSHSGCGGGVYNLGTLTLDHSTVSSNAAGDGSGYSTGGNPGHGGWAGGLCNLVH